MLMGVRLIAPPKMPVLDGPQGTGTVLGTPAYMAPCGGYVLGSQEDQERQVVSYRRSLLLTVLHGGLQCREPIVTIRPGKVP